MSLGPARHLDQYIWFRYLDPRRPNPRRRAGPKLIFRWYGKWCMAQTKLIAPVGCSGEVFVHFAAINPHTCLGLQVLSVSEPLSWSLLRFRRDGISGFRLRFTISRSLISHYLAWSYLGLKVLSESEPLSWSLLRFRRERNFGFPSSSSVYDQISGGNQWVWPLWSFSVSNNFAQKWVWVQRDTWINISDSDTLTQGDLTQGVALDQNSFLGDTENDVWPKLSWLPLSVVPGKCSFI